MGGRGVDLLEIAVKRKPSTESLSVSQMSEDLFKITFLFIQ